MRGLGFHGKILVGALLAVAVTLAACGAGVEGKYRDESGMARAEFTGGKAHIAVGLLTVDGTYKVDGNKILVTADFGPMVQNPVVFTVNGDGSLDPPRDSMLPRMEKVK